MRIDWIAKANHLLQTLPASLLVTALAGTAASYYFYARSQSSYLPAQPPAIEQVVDQLRHLLAGTGAAASTTGYLSLLQASVGTAIHMVPVDTVLLLEASDKYVRVLTAQHEYLIRTPLRELLPQLDPNQFWQIHRSHVVRAAGIDTVTRDDAGKLWLQLRARPERIAVSRLYAHRFKAM